MRQITCRAVDPGDGPVLDGCLLNFWRALFHPARLQRPDDLFYGSWTPRTKAWVDALTVLVLIFYLCVLLYGGYSGTSYSLEYGERSATAWRPYMWPLKIVTVGPTLHRKL